MVVVMRCGNMCAGRCGYCPGLSVLAALAAGAVLSSVRVGSRSPLAFQGTPDDARTLLFGITGTMITIIALLLGLAVVALQLSSTQFSPRLLRNFLRDRPNQVVLSAFVATFAYSAAGLYMVGVIRGSVRSPAAARMVQDPAGHWAATYRRRPRTFRPGSQPAGTQKSVSPYN
jgi:hypothetical protein